MIFVASSFGGLIAAAFFRDDVEQDRALIVRIAQVAQDGDKLVHVMAVNGADIVETELFKQRAACDHATGIFFSALGRPLDLAGQALGNLASQVTQTEELARRHQAGQVVRHRTHRWCDRHFIVVQHHDQAVRARTCNSGVVHGFVGHASGDRAVTNDRNHVALMVARVFFRA